MHALWLIIFLIWPSILSADAIRSAVRGEVDLRDWNGSDTLRIHGDWRFFPNELVSPVAARDRFGEGEGYLKPGQAFREYSPKKISNIGYGTYLVRVHSPCQRCRIYFAQPELYVAGKIFVFDETAPDDVSPLMELG